MGVDAQEALTEGDEAGDVEDGVGRELMELDAVNEKQPTKKLVGRNRKSAEDKGHEHHPPARFRARDYLVAGEPHLLVALRQQPGRPSAS